MIPGFPRAVMGKRLRFPEVIASDGMAQRRSSAANWSVPLNVPANTRPGDHIFLSVVFFGTGTGGGGNAQLTSPSGWSRDNYITSPGRATGVYYRKAEAGDAGIQVPVEGTQTGHAGGPVQSMAAAVVVVRGGEILSEDSGSGGVFSVDPPEPVFTLAFLRASSTGTGSPVYTVDPALAPIELRNTPGGSSFNVSIAAAYAPRVYEETEYENSTSFVSPWRYTVYTLKRYR